MKRTNGSHARRAGPLVAATTLVVSIALAFLPIGPAPVNALSPSPDPAASAAPSPDPGQSIAPDPTPTPTPTPTPSSTPLPPGVVSRDGGTIDAGYIHLTFPANAVTEPTLISISPAAGLPEFDGAAPLIGISITARTVETGDPVPSFGAMVTIRLAIGIPELADAELADLNFAELAPDRTWQPLGTRLIGIALVAAIGAPGTFGVVVNIPARPVAIDLDHSSDALAQGRHRIDPGVALTLTISARPVLSIASARFAESLPAGWTLVDAGGGAWDQQAGIVTWDLGKVRGRRTITRALVVRAPLTSPTDGAATFPATFSANITYLGGSEAAADVHVLVAPRVIIEHRTLARVDSETYRTTYLPVDQPLRNHQWYEVFRIRFQARNADSIPVGLTPLLQYRPAGTTAWTTVPAHEDREGVAFYVAPTRFRQVDPRRPNAPGPETAAIGTDEIKMHDRDDSEERPAPGTQSMGPNPAPTMTIPARSYTEIEFSVRDTADMQYLTTYEFRVTDDGTALQSAVTAVVQIGPQPPIPFSPGQRQGIWVGGPTRALRDDLSVAYRLQPPTGTWVDTSAPGADVIKADFRSTGPRYALLASAIVPSAPAPAALAAPVVGTHGPYSTTADQCALCHRQHTGTNRSLLSRPPPQSNLCFTCHDSTGTGANTKVQAQYTDGAPANDAATSSYYRHDALVTTTHTRADLNEFGGLSNRHNECGDCHNSHKANATDSTQTATGWTASGRLANISGVSVVNGIAGAAPTYTFLNGTTNPVTREYQLCFKCHSGFTTLPAQTAGKPAWWALDKGVEFNPANLSFHPIEAPGKNATIAMGGSLSGTSPYKLWNFTVGSVIRCVNCHGDPRKAILGVAAGSDLAPHAVANRGILMNNYRDRVLKSAGEAYAAADFALCFQCHAEAPFLTGPSATDMTLTNFSRHGHKVNFLNGAGGIGTDINTPGAGVGKAICAECHFRIHSTVYMVPQTSTGGRLVNAAPNIQSNNGVIQWTQTVDRNGIPNGGTCTLTCHGKPHNRSYSY